MSRNWHNVTNDPQECDAILTNSQNDIYTCVTTDKSEEECLKILQLEIATDGLTVFVSQDSQVGQCISQLGGLTHDQVVSIFEYRSNNDWKTILNCSAFDYGTDLPITIEPAFVVGKTCCRN